MSGHGIGALEWEDPDDELDLLDEDGNPLNVLDEDEAITQPGLDWTPDEGDDESETAPPPVEDWVLETDDPEIGPSVNLIPHSSFESTKDWSVGPGWTVAHPTSDAFHGLRIARFLRVAGGNGAGSELVSEAVSILPSITYWASFMSWMVAHTTGAGRFVARQYDGDSVWLQDLVLAEVREPQDGWVRYARRIGPRAPTTRDFAWHPEAAYVRFVFATVGDPVMDWGVDACQLETGMTSVYAPAPNEDIPGSEVEPGTLPPESFDTTPPSVPIITSVTSEASLDADGKPIVVLRPAFASLPPEPDFAGIEVFATYKSVPSDPDDPSSPRTPVWDQGRSFDFLAAGETVGSMQVFAATDYWVRALSIDTQGNRSDFSPVVKHTTTKDGRAPGVPEGLTVAPIFRGLVVTWGKSSAEDLAWYEVRYRIDGSGAEWLVLRTRTTVLSITGLEAGEDDSGVPTVTYEVQVRAIDTTGQVQTSSSIPIAVDAAAMPEAGWSVAVTGSPLLVGSVDIAARSILAEHIRAGEITTDKLGAGEIIINTTTDTDHPDGISIRSGAGDDAPELARWDEDGLILWAGADNRADYLKMDAGSLIIVKGDVVQTAITPDGIDATALRFGSAPGGHNLIFNSSFELNAAIAAPSTITDTVSADWSGSRVGSLSNLTEGANALAMTSTVFS